MPTDDPSNVEHVFLRPGSAGGNGTLLMLGGVGGLCFAAVGFVLAVFGRAGQLSLHAMTTLPALLSIGALTAGWALLRTPRRVGVGPDGLTVEARHGARRFRWDEVGCAAVETGSMNHRRRLNVTDLHGKSVVKLDESFGRFDEMVALISGYIEAKGDGTAERLFRKKARRHGALAFTVGLFLTAACVFVARTTYEDQRAARLLQEKGQPGEAEVIRRFVAPNGVTKRVEYRVTGPDGRSGTRNVEVEPAYWEGLDGARSVPVIVVPGEPGVSRLARGEVKDDDFTKTPAGGYGLAAVGGALALFMLGVSPFMWNGWDLAFDSKTQKWSLKRYGKVVWSSRGTAGR